jgi:hypothetical protein
MSKLDAFTWGGIGIVIAVAAVAVIALIVDGVRSAVRGWRRAGRVIDDAIADANARTAASIAAAGSEVLALICDPCNGRPGKCICTSKELCSHPLCGAADTGVSDIQFSRELRALLDKEGGRG